MITKIRILFLGLLMCYALPGRVLGQRLPPHHPSQASCTITGVVTDAVTGKPVAGAWASLRAGGLRTSEQFPPAVFFQEVLTDAAGRFEISAVSASYYDINVWKNGYVGWGTESYGCPTGPEAPAYQYPPIRLMPAAVISGRVTDGEGRPLSGATVQVMKAGYGDLSRGMVSGFGRRATTDDLGDYRLFGLSPGPYVVVVNYAADWSESNAHVFPSEGIGSALELAYPGVVLYPGTREISKAREILVIPGQHVAGIDFRLVAQRTYQVSGILSGIATGRGIAIPDIHMSICGNGLQALPLPPGVAGATGPNGQFLVRNVLPGCYDLLAEQRHGATREMAYLRLEVRNRDIDGLHLTLKPLPDVPLKVVVEGPPLQRDVRLVEIALQRENGRMVYTVNGTGGSQLIPQIPPGSYRVAVNRLSFSNNAYVKSAFLGARDILTGSVQILPGEDPGPLTVTFAQDGAELTGTVYKTDGKPSPMTTVVLVPAPALRMISCFYKPMRTDPSGRFVIQGIRPGSYTVFAWYGVRYGSWLDPMFLKRMQGRGIPLELGREERKTIRLRSIVVTPAEGGLR